MKDLFYVFIGSGLGGVLRFGISKWFSNEDSFPYKTLLANVLACLILGIILGMVENKKILSQHNILLWSVGFCGGLSTFSTFSKETLFIFTSGEYLIAVLYILLSIFLGLLFVWIGFRVVNTF